MRRGGKAHYASHIQTRNVSVERQIRRSTMQSLRHDYPAFFAPGAMHDRIERARLRHHIGRETGFDPLTGRRYREQKKETKRWRPPSGAAKTEKGRKAQETKVGFGARGKKRKKGDGSGDSGGGGPPGPQMPVSRADIPRVKVEDVFSEQERQLIQAPDIDPAFAAAHKASLEQQRRTGVATVGTGAPPTWWLPRPWSRKRSAQDDPCPQR